MKDAILVFDVGTTNFKTMLFGTDGEVVLTLPVSFRPAYSSGGMVYQDPADWRRAVTDGALRAAAYAEDNGIAVVGVSLTASRSSVIPVDKDGGHIGPAMMWQETASRAIVNNVNHGAVLQDIFARTGSRPNTVYSAPKMTWLRRNNPAQYREAHKLVGILDYLTRFLTGKFVTDHTCASRTLLMDIRTRMWDDDMLKLFEVERDKLCDLIPPGSIAGGLTAETAKLTGLPTGLPIVVAGGDQNNAALGARVIRQGDVMVNMGTGSFLIAAIDEAVTDPEMRVMCNASCIPGKYIIDAGMLTTGSVHRWFVETFYNELPESQMKERYNKADAEAELAPPGCDGLLVLPHFSGSGAPHWDNSAKGVFYGLGMEHRRQNLSRAIYEGIAGEVAANLAVARSLVGGEMNVLLAGGLSQCRFFDQLLADVCGHRMQLSSSAEATARGAWSQAMVALGKVSNHEEALSRGESQNTERFSPDPAKADIYREFLHRREALFTCLAAMRENA